MTSKNSRRLVALAVLGLVVAACGGGDETADGANVECEAGVTDAETLNFYNWSEYIDPELILAFEAETGVDVVESFYESNEAMLAQIQAGVTYDLIVPSDYMVGIMIEEGLLMPIQKNAMPNISNLASEFTSPAYDPGGEYSVAYQWGTTGLGVNLSIVGEDFEPSWALIFDPELTSGYAGGVSVLDDPRETMGAALKYLGYSLNEASTDALQEAADLIAAAKDNIATFDSDQYDEALVTGEVAVAHGYSGNMIVAIGEADDPDNYAYVVPQEGGTLWVDNMAIPADSAAPCTAHAFIDFLLDAENGAALTNWNYYASPNAAAEPFIDPEVLEDETVYPSDELRSRLEIIADTGDFEINFEDYFAQAKN
jgi:spermidine/putrescine-binding protein